MVKKNAEVALKITKLLQDFKYEDANAVLRFVSHCINSTVPHKFREADPGDEQELTLL